MSNRNSEGYHKEYIAKKRAEAKALGVLTQSDYITKKNNILKRLFNGCNSSIKTIQSVNLTMDDLHKYSELYNKDLKNINVNVMSILTNPKKDQLFTKDEFIKYADSPSTAQSYWSRINNIKEIIETFDDNELIKKIQENPRDICDKIYNIKKDQTHDFINSIIFIINHFENIHIDDEVRDIYITTSKEYLKNKTNKKINYKYAWDYIVKLRTTLDKGFKYFIVSLYSLIPPMRDDFGLVKIAQNDTNINTTDNFYIIDKGEFIFNHYKTSRKYGTIRFIAPKLLQNIINESLEKNPRDYLITKNENKTNVPYGVGNKYGKISNIIKDLFIDEDLRINDFRHAYESYIVQYGLDFTYEEKQTINKIMAHNSNQRESYACGKLRSIPLFMDNIDMTNDTVQRLSDKTGGFYDIGDKVVEGDPPNQQEPNACENTTSTPLFIDNIDMTNDNVQQLPDKTGDFNDIGDKVIDNEPKKPQKIKIRIKR